ncbi:DUF1800 family protein [Marinospirillum perlucidum]|uniref:DUF1800 family protein n=1 Tax=Marinospirillum perlucidum TaxID=1982602 RepID=UPI000DF45985|nr:DUF1800 family protein [Marinospirillum perlucidum]
MGEFHPLVSPLQTASATGEHGSLQGLSDFWSSNHAQNLIPAASRDNYTLDAWRAPERIWVRAAHTPGLNPARQKIGFYLTNYHLAANQDAGVTRHQIVNYYDQIMEAVAADLSFDQVLTRAAGHAAIAVQYNHKENHFDGGAYQVNEDFAREYFQLFFGILSDRNGSDDYHENTSIPNMARLLTEMYPEERRGAASATMIYENYKIGSPLEILHHTISAGNAQEALEQLGPLAIQHPDSLNNLPIIIVQWLADDTLSDYPARQQRIRDYWASLDEKNLMTFLKGYATSTDFHTGERIKYYSTFDRSLILSNRMITDVQDAVRNIYDPQGSINSSGFSVFRPHHNVFGAQTGEDAYGSSEYFLRTFNRFTRDSWRFARTTRHEDDTLVWEKDWSGLLPPAESGFSCLTAKTVGEWLWQRFVADGLKNFGPLERVQVYALINNGKDAAATWHEAYVGGVAYDSQFSETELSEGGGLHEYYQHQANACVFTSTREERLEVADHLGKAVNFITNTPYMFFQEGR